MKRTALTLLCGSAVALAAWSWTRSQAATLQTQNQSLQSDALEARRLRDENAALAHVRQLPIPETPGDFSRTELIRLRNEVARGRAQAADPDALRLENQQLEQQLSNVLAQPGKIEESEGYVSQQAWIDKGFATPQSTVLTFFAALRQGNPERILECLTADQAEVFQDTLQTGARDRLLNTLQTATSATGFQMTRSTKPQLPGEVTIRLQAANGGAVLEMELIWEEAGWKIQRPFRAAR